MSLEDRPGKSKSVVQGSEQLLAMVSQFPPRLACSLLLFCSLQAQSHIVYSGPALHQGEQHLGLINSLRGNLGCLCVHTESLTNLSKRRIEPSRLRVGPEHASLTV